jgi:hypothetical protein
VEVGFAIDVARRSPFSLLVYFASQRASGTMVAPCLIFLVIRALLHYCGNDGHYIVSYNCVSVKKFLTFVVVVVVGKCLSVKTHSHFRCDFRCDIFLLMHVNEWMRYECSDEGTYTQNINNSSTGSHRSEEENRPRTRSKKCVA